MVQKLPVKVNAPRLEVPVPGLGLTNRFGGNAPHRPTSGVAGGLLKFWKEPVKAKESARVTAAWPRHRMAKVSVVSPILLS